FVIRRIIEIVFQNPAKFDPLKRLTRNFIAMRILVWGLPNYPFIGLTPLSTEEKSMQCKSLERKNALFDQHRIRIKEKVVPVKQRYFTVIRGYTGIYLQLLWRICQLENRTPRVAVTSGVFSGRTMYALGARTYIVCPYGFIHWLTEEESHICGP
ncbi:hypothetical protein J6590_107216, partial [Homalodisca vitripennis]